eukprot:Pgem_evm1s9815
MEHDLVSLFRFSKSCLVRVMMNKISTVRKVLWFQIAKSSDIFRCYFKILLRIMNGPTTPIKIMQGQNQG